MPQSFQVLRCASCRSFQGQQVKKSNKWICKLCGEKQSLLKVYGQGSGADCRCHVQKLNMMRGEMVLAAELKAGSFDVSEEPNDAHIAQKENWSLQEEMSSSASRWEKYLENCNEGLCPEAEECEGSMFTTDRQQFCSDRKNALRAHRKRKSDQAFHSSDAQDCRERSSYQEHKQKANKAASSCEVWKGSTAGAGQGHCDAARELPTPGKNSQHVPPPFEQPSAASSKWGRFLSPARACGDREEQSDLMPSVDENKEASKSPGTDTANAFLQDVPQWVGKDHVTPNAGDHNRKGLGNNRHSDDGLVFKPQTSLLGIQYPSAVRGIIGSAWTGFPGDPLPEQQMWTGPTVEKNEKQVTSSQLPRLFSGLESAPSVLPLPYAASGARGCLFQTDDDFDDDI